LTVEWVDFRAVKNAVSMEMVLAHYNVRLRKVNNTYLRGKCPLPMHTSKESGDSFGTDTMKNAWACQSDSCVKVRLGKKGGNVMDFVALMEKCSIRDAAVKLQKWFSTDSNFAPEHNRTGHIEPKLVSKREREGSADLNVSTSNRPLEFTLKGIDATHEYIAQRAITPETAATFGVGFFPGRGSMFGRVVIPICNRNGELVAYAGRSIDNSAPKYKLPGGGFRKSIELFNLHRALETASDCVIVVEGFFDCMLVHQAGYSSVIALMGSTLSSEQETVLTENFSRIVLMLDGDEAGREATMEIAQRLVRRMFVKAIALPDGAQPDHFCPNEICSLLGSL
jgi:DNA primase